MTRTLRRLLPSVPAFSPRSLAAFAILAAVLTASPAAAADPVDVDQLLADLQILSLAGTAPAPFALADLAGRRWSLADLRGRPALLYFWEST